MYKWEMVILLNYRYNMSTTLIRLYE